jgi:hypothetical protein
LHNYLKLLENPAELKRRLPASSNPRTLKEGLYETSRLVGVDEAMLKDVQTIAALIGTQRFIMTVGEPSVADHVARVFDHLRLLLTGLVSAVSFENAPVGQMGAGPQQGGAIAALSPGWAQHKSEQPAARTQPDADEEARLDSLKRS